MDLEGMLEGAKTRFKDANLAKAVQRHFSDGTAVAAVYTPAYALLETTIAGMSHEISQDARLLGLATIYAGLGNLIGTGRNLSKKIFNITENTSEKMQQLHDTLYLGFSAIVINPPFYLAAGVRDPQEIFWGTVGGAGLGMAVGIPMGYAIDSFRDLTGVEPSKRLPKMLAQKSKKAKQAIAIGLVAGAAAITGLVYAAVPDKDSEILKPSITTEQVVDVQVYE